MLRSLDANLCSHKAGPLTGTIDIPGDKSISHRSLIVGSLAIGRTHISGLLESADVLATKDALVALGVLIKKSGDIWQVNGVGLNGMLSPMMPLNLGNSGTGVRLLMGVVAGQNITAVFTGDASLTDRPMERVTEPLRSIGASIITRDGKLPVTIKGSNTPAARQHISEVASAQIKSAILLASLNARGATEVIEPHASRDHSEAMLRHFDAKVTQLIDKDGRHIVTLHGEAKLNAQSIVVPRDPSSAAFAVVAALITPGSDITISDIGMNPLRTGLFDTLVEMGGSITRFNEREDSGNLLADLRVKSSCLQGVTVPSNRVASMIDEYPILSVAASAATGTTKMLGIAELRVKETDRIKVMADGLRLCGVKVNYDDDSIQVTGGTVIGGINLSAQHDHRIGMSFLILGMVADWPITVSGCATIETSFPKFACHMTKLGAQINGVKS